MKPRFRIMFIEHMVLCLPYNEAALSGWNEWNSKLDKKDRKVFWKHRVRIPKLITFADDNL